MYNSTTFAGAIKTAVKNIIIDCTPPIIKYPLLCAALATCHVTTFATGGNSLVVLAIVTIE